MRNEVALVAVIAAALAAYAAAKNPAGIDVKAASELIAKNKQNKDFVILDVRTPEEYGSGHLENAVNLDFHGQGFSERLAALPKDKTYLVHCAAGVRSARTVRMLQKLGFEKTYNMKGGIRAWVQAGLPTKK